MTDKQSKYSEDTKEIRKAGTELVDLITEKGTGVSSELVDELCEVLTKIDRARFHKAMNWKDVREVETPTEMEAERWKNTQEIGINNTPFIKEDKETKE